MRVLYVGSGAVNLCLAAWMHDAVSATQFLVRSADNPMIASGTFTCTLPEHGKPRTYNCSAFASLNEVELPDLIVVGVKNYSLDGVLDEMVKVFGKSVPILSVLNGVSHIRKISERFEDPMFATIIFNAYRQSLTAAVAVGNAVGLSAPGQHSYMFNKLVDMLRPQLDLSVVKRPMDAAQCKLVINLGNALLTIVGFHENRVRELPVLQQLTATIMNEGVDVLQKSGVQEAKISGMPPWFLIRASKMLPQWITVPIFKKRLKDHSINSMAQDVSKGSAQTELEDINGYFLKMADKANASVPYNRALYHIFKDWSGRAQEPLTPSELLAGINSFSNR